MWTLIIIALINGAGPSSGPGSSISSLIFASQDQCTAAAAQIDGSSYVGVDMGGPYHHRQMRRARRQRRRSRECKTLTVRRGPTRCTLTAF